MEFLSSRFLYFLLLLPLFLLLYITRSKARAEKLHRILGKNRAFLTGSTSVTKRSLKVFLSLGTIALFVFALARPQWIGGKSEKKKAGLYMVLAVDISVSMLAEDIKPSRLAFMKRELTRFLDLSEGDKVAIVAFAGEAVLISPFTNDHSIIKLYLKDLSPSYLSAKGSNFRRLFSQIERAFEGIKSKEGSAAKIVVLASDGEDHDEISPSSLYNLTKQDIRFFTLSFGTKEGGVIPLRDKQRKVVSYKRNAKNEVVVTKVKVKTLKKIASMTKGAYYHVNYDGKAMDTLRVDIDELEKEVFQKKSTHSKNELYQWFLALGLLLAFLELFLNEVKSTKKKGFVSIS